MKTFMTTAAMIFGIAQCSDMPDRCPGQSPTMSHFRKPD